MSPLYDEENLNYANSRLREKQSDFNSNASKVFKLFIIKELTAAGNKSLTEKSQEVDQLKTSIVELKSNAQKAGNEKDVLSKKHVELSSNYDAQAKDLNSVKSEIEEQKTAKEILTKKHEEALSKIKTLEVLNLETKEQIAKMTELLEKVRNFF